MKRLLGICFVLVYSVAFVAAQSDLQPLATVKLHSTESITLKQLKERVATYAKQAGIMNFTVEQKKEILDAMIDEKLVVQAALQAGMNITDSQLNEAFLQSISGQVGYLVTEQEFAAIVKSQSGMSLDDYFEASIGMDLEEYKEYFKSQLIAQQYVLALKQSELQKTSVVTDSEIRSFFEINKASFVQNDILKLFLVIAPKGNNATAAKNIATSLHTDLKNNTTTYDELKIKMQDPTAGFQAGDIYVSKGTLAAQQLGIDYAALLDLFTQNIGFFDDVKETATDYQFHIVQEKHDAKMLALDDVVQPDTTVTVYEYIREQLSSQKQQQAFAAAVEEVTNSLRTPENYQMLKSGAALDSLLDW